MKIGVDLGGSHIAVGVVTPQGKILRKVEEDINFANIEKEEIENKIRDTIVSLINSVLKQLEIPSFIIEEIGIGIPGIVENNKIKKCEKFGLYDVDFAKPIAEKFSVNTILKNDAECAAIAETVFGNLKNIEKAVFLCLGTGIGGATIIDGQVNHSEYGHMIIEKDGVECHCSNKGCFEQYCSMRVFKNNIIKLLELRKDTSSRDILNILRIQSNNRALNQYIDEYLNDLIIGLTNIINIINPEVICFGGGFTYYEDILYTKLVEKLKKCNCEFEKPKLILADLQNDAGIIGATLI